MVEGASGSFSQQPLHKIKGWETQHHETIVPVQKEGRRVVGQLLHQDYEIALGHTEETEDTISIRCHCRKYVEDYGWVCEQRPNAVLETLWHMFDYRSVCWWEI